MVLVMRSNTPVGDDFLSVEALPCHTTAKREHTAPL
jgi:hypothetical protein